jgi:hypothetical protein
MGKADQPAVGSGVAWTVGRITGQKKTTRRFRFSFDQRAACEVVDSSKAHLAPEVKCKERPLEGYMIQLSF